MAKVQEIKVLTFGEKSFPVETLSLEIQALVEHYNTMSVVDAELRSKLFTVALAKKQTEREIEAVYVREQQELAKKAAVDAPVEGVSSDKAVTDVQ